MLKRRVVVTGLGIVSPMGLTVESTWNAVLQGKSGAGPIQVFDVTSLSVRICAAVKNFDATSYLDPKEARRTDLFIQYAVAAAAQAIADAALEVDDALSHRVGVSIGSGMGGLPWIEKNHAALMEGGARKISPFFIPGAIINMASGLVSIQHGLKGPSISMVSACTTGTHNIGMAARMIGYGDADVMVAGGTEMSTTPLGVGGFASMRALSTRNDDPERASRPWDKDRDGFLLGEGAGVVVLEEYEFARKRGARIYAEVAGFGMSSDAYHITAPEEGGEGAVAAMMNTLRDAEMNPDQVDYINAHGTSTVTGDKAEVVAVKKTFGASANRIAVSSTKSMTGHLLGAAGAVEAIFCMLAIRDQVAPPTINLDHPDVDCDLDFVPHTARPMKIEVTLSNSFGFGGTNGSLLFRRL